MKTINWQPIWQAVSKKVHTRAELPLLASNNSTLHQTQTFDTMHTDSERSWMTTAANSTCPQMTYLANPFNAPFPDDTHPFTNYTSTQTDPDLESQEISQT